MESFYERMRFYEKINYHVEEVFANDLPVTILFVQGSFYWQLKTT